jgi:hypothetical protein
MWLLFDKNKCCAGEKIGMKGIRINSKLITLQQAEEFKKCSAKWLNDYYSTNGTQNIIEGTNAYDMFKQLLNTGDAYVLC